jgi:hypothetical protein
MKQGHALVGFDGVALGQSGRRGQILSILF